MRLQDLHIVGREGLADLSVAGDRIARITDAGYGVNGREKCLCFKDALALPGLINSHDHLDFDLFPPLRSRSYTDYKEWGSDIHRRYRESIAAVLRVPRELRIRWGLYKNLLGGVTSVVHHGARLDIPTELISVFQDAESLHSVSGEKGWRRKLMSPFGVGRPLVIHTGEGTTPECYGEIDRLIRWNIFSRPLIGIHAIAMDPQQASAFRALVWCPDSNFFLYGRTANVPLLMERTKIVFGTDSTLTASWNIWEQLRLARDLKMVKEEVLWDMVTGGSAHLWGLDHRGTIDEGEVADLVIAEKPAGSVGWDTVFGLDPSSMLLVLSQGKIRLFDASLKKQLSHGGYSLEDFWPVVVGGRIKYVLGDLPGLLEEIHKHHPDALFPVTAL